MGGFSDSLLLYKTSAGTGGQHHQMHDLLGMKLSSIWVNEKLLWDWLVSKRCLIDYSGDWKVIYLAAISNQRFQQIIFLRLDLYAWSMVDGRPKPIALLKAYCVAEIVYNEWGQHMVYIRVGWKMMYITVIISIMVWLTGPSMYLSAGISLWMQCKSKYFPEVGILYKVSSDMFQTHNWRHES